MANASTSPGAAETFIQRHEREVAPLEIKLNQVWWEANVSGKEADFAKKEKLQNELDGLLSNPKTFAELLAAKNSLKPATPALLRRQIEVLYLQYLEKQLDPKKLAAIVAKSNEIEKTFNVFRAKVNGKELSDSEVRKILKSSTDSAQRKEVWEASKEVGGKVAEDLKKLVHLRNEAARALGYQNFHALQLKLGEQDPEAVLKLFDELDLLTRTPFESLKAEVDQKLAKRYGISPDKLSPWHYEDPFFQESPSVFAADFDSVYAKLDIVKLARDFYHGIGLDIERVLSRSDLSEKSGKSPHAFCTDIDRRGDVRVLANIVPNEYWMSTMLHELGHSVYSSLNIPKALPYALRTEAHILTTEGVAMLFQKFSKTAAWMQKMGIALNDSQTYEKAGADQRRSELLIFSRWCQVMFRFEKGLYENPDQDLGRLWWDLVEKYQGLRRPEGRSAPDYASKIHVVIAPAYYHNYMMGELFASQVFHTVAREVLKLKGKVSYGGAADKFVGNPAIGAFFKKKIFDPGRTLPWNELTKHATGESLTAKYFALDFVDSK